MCYEKSPPRVSASRHSNLQKRQRVLLTRNNRAAQKVKSIFYFLEKLFVDTVLDGLRLIESREMTDCCAYGNYTEVEAAYVADITSSWIGGAFTISCGMQWILLHLHLQAKQAM